MERKHPPRTPDEVWEYVDTEEDDALEAAPAAELAAMHQVITTRADIEGLPTGEPQAQRAFDDEEPDVFSSSTATAEDDEQPSVADLLVAQHYLTPED